MAKKSGTSQYGTIEIKNASPAAMELYVTDPEGGEHFVCTLAAGAKTIQFTQVGMNWSLVSKSAKIPADKIAPSASPVPDDDDGGRGGDVKTADWVKGSSGG